MASLQASMLAFLYARFPAELSPDPRHEGYVMAWLALADELQIDGLRSVCLRFVRGLAFNGRLEDTLLQRVIPAGGGGRCMSSAVARLSLCANRSSHVPSLPLPQARPLRAAPCAASTACVGSAAEGPNSHLVGAVLAAAAARPRVPRPGTKTTNPSCMTASGR